jgi:integrase
VPIFSPLRKHLLEHRMLQGRPEGLVFGRRADKPFTPTFIQKRADDAWRQVKLQRITLQEFRHVAASAMIRAGVNAKALSTFMGHSSISVTFDVYGHLFPGSEDEAAELVNAMLERSGS